MRTGRCQCGKLRYQFQGLPLTCYACHCTDCQSASGSAFTLSMIVNNEDVNITQGDIAINSFEHKGNLLNRYHCEQCGAGIWYRADSIPGISALKPGTLDETDWFKPVAHVWTQSALPWVTFDDNTPRYEQQPEMSELLVLWEQQN